MHTTYPPHPPSPALDHHTWFLSELYHGQKTIAADVAEVKERLKESAQVHQDHRSQLSQHAQEIEKLKAAREKPPPIEVWLKHVATVAIPLGTLWATGSFEKALAVYAKLHGVAIP